MAKVLKAMFKVLVVAFSGFGFAIQICFSQCPSLNFAAPASACLNQTVQFSYVPSGTEKKYAWDLCDGSLLNTATAQSTGPLPLISNAYDLAITSENGVFIGFVANSSGNTISSLVFQNGINQAPAVSAITGSGIVNPQGVEVYEENQQKYLIVATLPGDIVLLSFGSSFLNAPSTRVITSGFSNARHLSAVVTGSSLFILVPGTSSVNSASVLTVLSMGNSIANNVQSRQDIPVAGSNYLTDAVAVNECGSWYVLTDGYLGGLYRLSFGSSLTNVPTIATISGMNELLGMKFEIVEGNRYLFLSSGDGSNAALLRFDFGTSVSNLSPTVNNLGDYGQMSFPFAFDVATMNTKYYGASIGYSNNSLTIFDFPKNCLIQNDFQNTANVQVSYSGAGTQHVTLFVEDAAGSVTAVAKTLTVQNLQAPDIDFSSQNDCVTAGIVFTSSNVSGNISTYQWDFGDGQTSPSMNPTNHYASVGTYAVKLVVAASNGCQNMVQKNQSVYNPPVAAFVLPTANPYCTNHNYVSTNTSTFDPGSNPAWEWRVNSVLVSSSADLNYAFTSATPQQIALTAIIPGCSNTVTQTINTIIAGPLVDFTANNACLGMPVNFSNTSIGSGLTYTWSFGDGNTSGQQSLAYTYLTIGPFSVNLLAASSNGCQNSITRTVTVYTTPQASFDLGLPPFSCSGKLSQFTDTTPSPTDSNLAGWFWNFGDPANGTSTQQDATYTYANAGQYNVTFTVTTDFNCSATVQKTVTIAASPVASFTSTAACVDQQSQFTDTSGPGIKTRVWQIGNTLTTAPSPFYIPASPGPFVAQLTITANNNCIDQVMKTIAVPVPEDPDFSTLSTCAGKPAVFRDITVAGSDATVAEAWDFAGQATGTGSPAQHIFPSTGNFSVTMSNTTQSGCVYSVTKSVAIITAPQANFSTSADSGAPPLALQFTNTSQQATSYEWHFNNATNDSSALVSPSYTYTALGDYVVDLTAYGAQSCSDTFSRIIHVVVASVDIALEQLQFVRDNNTGELQAVFYLENKGNLPLSNPTIILEFAGGASIKENLNLTLSPGQTTSQTLNYSLLPTGLAYICVSVDEAGDVNLFNNKECNSFNNDEVIFAPYPNPTGGELHLDWIASSNGAARITIFTSTGAKALDQQLTPSGAGLNQTVIDVSNLHSGVYLAQFKYLGNQKTFRFVVN